MLNKLQTKREQKTNVLSFVVLLLCLLTTSAYAAESLSVTNAGDMLNRITSQFPAITRLVTAFAYVAGTFFIFSSLLKMKRLGEMRTMMMQERSVAGPLIYLFVGAALLYLPSAVQMGMTSFWSEPNPYGYIEDKGGLDGVISACFMAVQLFGIIAFIRGLLILSHLANQGGGGQQSASRGMTHIIGGIFCINIYQFVKVIFATIGIEISGFNS